MSASIEGKARVRFAPSPTGYLHIGGARTALFNYLFARRQGGTFLLRIEDTDAERSSPEMTENILASLRWLGLDWDGEPVFQSSRRPDHERACRSLLEKGFAYPCFCDPEEIRKRRETAPQPGAEYKYDRRCLGIPASEAAERMRRGESHAVRFRIPDGRTSFHDLIRGEVTVEHAELDDFVILRSDGSPVYQAAVVVDDHAMGITHVIRGDDHLSNTPKQILLYRALGWEVPAFAHVPMILGPDKKRLSKRHGATSVEEYRRQGILPGALRNFLGLLGWSPGDDREVMSLQETVEAFSLEAVSKKSAVFDEKKLAWMNSRYLAALSDDELAEQVAAFLPAGAADVSTREGRESLLAFVRLMRPRAQKLTEFFENGAYFFTDPDAYDEPAAAKHWADRGAAELLDALDLRLADLPDWAAGGIETAVRSLAEGRGIKAGTVIHSARLALAGCGASPGLFELMETLGRASVHRRLGRAAAWIRSKPG
jgi:glutamyl-tRNA synthetase